MGTFEREIYKLQSRRNFISAVTAASGAILLLPVLSGIAGNPSISIPNKKSGLTLENQGADLVCMARNGKPLLASRCHFEHLLFEDLDYEEWTRWAVAHGMNHCHTNLYYGYYTE